MILSAVLMIDSIFLITLLFVHPTQTNMYAVTHSVKTRQNHCEISLACLQYFLAHNVYGFCYILF